MKLTLSQPQYLKDSIAIISELVTEARFNVTSDGLTLIAMDPANVAMVVFKLLSSSFVEYNLSKDVDLALNLNNLKQVLRRVSSQDMLTLEMEDESKLKITITGKTTRRFKLPIIELDEREQKIPNLQFPLTATLPADTLLDAVEDADVVADSLSISGDAKRLLISAQGDLSNVEVEIKGDDNVTIASEGEDAVKSKYSIEYLKKMVGGSRVSDQVKLQLSKDYPLRIEFIEKDKLQLSFVLAPRVEND
jgi:proliferating cell nuclear antigen